MAKSWNEMVGMRETLPEPVYYVESPEDDSVLVGIDVAVTRRGDGKVVATWHDTTHERGMIMTQMKKVGQYFGFKRIETEGGQHYYFTPMNLEVYNAKVKDKLGRIEFQNKEEMIKAFLETAEW